MLDRTILDQIALDLIMLDQTSVGSNVGNTMTEQWK